MAERDIVALVADLTKEAEQYRDLLSQDRIKAIEYYDGTMYDTPSDKGRSSVVSRDVRSTIQKVLPSLTRVFLSSDQIVEYKPAHQGDEQFSEQATDYINHVVFPECEGDLAITDSIHDCLKLRNGVLTWWYEEKINVSVSSHSGLDEQSFATLVSDEGVEVLEHSARQEQVKTPQGVIPTVVHDLKIKQKKTDRRPRVQCLPMEDFLIHPDALDEDTAPLIGRKTSLRRTELVAMGYDKKIVDALPLNGSDGKTEDAEKLANRPTIQVSGSDETAPELQEIDYYELYVRIDADGDGIAELHRMCFGGAVSSNGLLADDECDEVPYAITAVKRRPHQWEGVSVADDVMDLQRIKTVLLRGTMDNLYWQNNMQMAMKRDAVENPDALTNPQFGQTIWLNNNYSAADAMQPVNVPFVAHESFGMLEYLDHEKKERTGIGEASGGLASDALQNVTAKASAMIEQQGIGQAELMARTLAVGFRRMFKGLLKLIIKHQDKPRMVRLRDKWVEFDPRQWNADMDCTVNTGLGAGTRERDMVVLQNVLALQEKVYANLGPQNPFVTPENLGNTLFKLAESAGLKSPRLYFSKPKPEEITAMQEAQKNKPDPEMQKIQMQIEADKQTKAIDLQFQTEVKRLEIEANDRKEIIQSKAAVEERQAVSQIEAADKDRDRALEKYKIDQQLAFDREKLEMDNAVKLAPLGQAVGQDGKPYDVANQKLEMLVTSLMAQLDAQLQHNLKPKRVTTPDGESFLMETMQ